MTEQIQEYLNSTDPEIVTIGFMLIVKSTEPEDRERVLREYGFVCPGVCNGWKTWYYRTMRMETKPSYISIGELW